MSHPKTSPVLKWGDLRERLVSGRNGPYDFLVRVAACSLDAQVDVGMPVPWESGALGTVFSPGTNKWFPKVVWPELDTGSAVGRDEPATDAQVKAVKARPWKASVMHARAWLDAVDDRRSKVLETWKALLLSSAKGTSMGASLLKCQEQADHEARAGQIISDIFARKSTATLQARATSLLQFSKWKTSVGMDPAVFPVPGGCIRVHVFLEGRKRP